MGFVPITYKKASMGYLNANQRPCCRNCANSRQSTQSMAGNDLYPWRCVLGGFGVTVQAVCNHHVSTKQGATA